VFRYEVLDSGNAGRPESEEGDEDYGTVVEREVIRVVSKGGSGLFPAAAAAAGKRD
jgi:hypothetical protein